MELKSHNRYGYSPIIERRDYDWPDGKRLAVYFALNIEHFSFGEGLGHTPTHPGTPPDVRNYSWRDYGLRVGIWRIFDLFDELELPACHLMNAAIYDYAPQIPARIRARGDEFIGHGRTNSEEQAACSEHEERRLIGETTEMIRLHEGDRPGGWMGPWISESERTPDLLKEGRLPLPAGLVRGRPALLDDHEVGSDTFNSLPYRNQRFSGTTDAPPYSRRFYPNGHCAL